MPWEVKGSPLVLRCVCVASGALAGPIVGALLLPNHGQLEAIYFSMLPSIITLVVGAGMIALASMSPEVTSSGRLTAQA